MTRAAWMESVARGQRASGGGEERAPTWALDCPVGCRLGAREECGASVGRPAEAELPVSSRAARPGGWGQGSKAVSTLAPESDRRGEGVGRTSI